MPASALLSDSGGEKEQSPKCDYRGDCFFVSISPFLLCRTMRILADAGEPTVGLAVNADNAAARTMYVRLGFRIYRVRTVRDNRE
jgi:hypothetical protein